MRIQNNFLKIDKILTKINILLKFCHHAGFVQWSPLWWYRVGNILLLITYKILKFLCNFLWKNTTFFKILFSCGVSVMVPPCSYRDGNILLLFTYKSKKIIFEKNFKFPKHIFEALFWCKILREIQKKY